MGRFDRNESHSPENFDVAGSASEKLRSTVERQVREVVEEAMARAHAIEDRALAKASEVEQESHRKAGEYLIESRERAGNVLGSVIDRTEAMRDLTATLESEFAKVVATFRGEIEALASELSAARQELAVETPPTAPAPEPEPEPAPEPVAARAAAPSGDLHARDMVRQQLIRIRDDGKPRQEAERYLARFKQGSEYNDVLNEIFPDAAASKPPRRGLLRRSQGAVSK